MAKKSDSRRQAVYELQERGSEVLEECRRQSVYTAKQKELIHKRQKRWAITLAVPIPYLDVGTAYFVRSRYTFEIEIPPIFDIFKIVPVLKLLSFSGGGQVAESIVCRHRQLQDGK